MDATAKVMISGPEIDTLILGTFEETILDNVQDDKSAVQFLKKINGVTSITIMHLSKDRI